jgi:hypothetical protein
MSVTLLVGLKTFIETNVASAGTGYPQEVPQGLTGWAYNVIDDIQDIGHSGALNFFKARIQIDLQYTATANKSAYKVTHEIADAMRAALDGYKGTMSSAQVKFCKTETTDDWAEIAETPSIRFDILINYKL